MMNRLRRILNKLKKNQDVATTFKNIYSDKRWGGTEEEKFNSGAGSEDSISIRFIEFATKYIAENNIKSIVDLGCGDFRVGSKMVSPTVEKYIGIDVVEELINHHQNTYGSEIISFNCLDIINDELPEAELCVIRQVLQHLSNQQVAEILVKVRKYKYLIICDHIPGGTFTPNKDKKHGADIRLKDNSGLVFNEAPFNENLKIVDTFTLETFGDGTSKLLTWIKND